MTTRTQWHPLPMKFRRIAAKSPGAVLLETALREGESDKSFLFLNPVATLVAWRREDLDGLLEAIDSYVDAGCFVAGYFNYECGEHFVGLSPSGSAAIEGEPIAWLGVYRAPIEFDHRSGAVYGELPSSSDDEEKCDHTEPVRVEGLQISKREYEEKIARAQEYLAAGDTYQINFTVRLSGLLQADALTVYNTLLQRQPVSFAAFVHRPQGPVLSFSPELFYRTAEGRVTVRPMKGTWARGANLELDRKAEEELRDDIKNRSEHVTIVDLLRNDVGKVCEAGSVRVDKLLEVERYATLLQMTSTVSGQLRRGITPTRVFRNLFPSGSITGAPKRRTMEIIRELEAGTRGVYTGAIGYFGPGGTSCFNVAIRTMSVAGERFVMGVGGGITADSWAEDEFRECEMKVAFLTKRERSFSLIETMKCSHGIELLERHMKRLRASAEYFGIDYDEECLREEINAVICGAAEQDTKVRLELSRDGTWRIAASPLDTVRWHGHILLADEKTRAGDVYLQHKTMNRAFYDQHLDRAHKAEFDEVVFLNEDAQLTEGAISNIFLKIDGAWRTPLLSCGLLPGVQRAELLERLGNVQEAVVGLADIRRATEIWMCNALRGVRSVRMILAEDGSTVWRAE